jgi:multidrug efflux system outer membrane protein
MTSSLLSQRGALALALLALAGCSFVPIHERPSAPVPATFPGQAADAPAVVVLPAWDRWVADARLRELMVLALQNNRDLRVATLNMEQVRAMHQIRQADQWPMLNLAVAGNRQPTADGGMSSTYTAGLAMASWELDFFGRVASLKEAALAQFLASEEARRAAQTSLVAAVASTWLALQGDEALLSLTQRSLGTRDESVRLTRLRFDNGATSALDLRQAESLAAAARSALSQQQRARALNLNALTLLLGQVPPPELLPSAPDPGSEPLLGEVPAGLPSDLLTRRADIRQAEKALVAANANIGAARAALFPRIALTASLGTVSNQLSGLFDSGSWGFSLAPQALLPIFDGGRNRANLEAARVAREIAVAQYEKAIQTAFREVADALAGRRTLAEQLAAQQAQAQAEAERLRLADLRYRNGVSSYLEVLDAQRSLFATQQALVQTRQARQQSQVALFKALGGGWDAGPTKVN